MILKPFTAILTKRLEAADYTLPLTDGDTTRLLNQLGVGETSLLVLRDDIYTEEIEVENTCGVLVIKARGMGNTEPRKFPQGSAVCFEVTVSVVEYLICNFDCCSGAPCPPEPVTIAGFFLPAAVVGQSWMGMAIFNGATPMELTASGVPSWATTEVGANYVKISGVPTGAGTETMSVAGTNAAGAVVTQAAALVIT
jgi:hypothetical protein